MFSRNFSCGPLGRPCLLTKEKDKNPIGTQGKDEDGYSDPNHGRNSSGMLKKQSHQGCNHSIHEHHKQDKPAPPPGAPEPYSLPLGAVVVSRLQHWLNLGAFPARIESVLNLFAACWTFPHCFVC